MVEPRFPFLRLMQCAKQGFLASNLPMPTTKIKFKCQRETPIPCVKSNVNHAGPQKSRALRLLVLGERVSLVLPV